MNRFLNDAVLVDLVVQVGRKRAARRTYPCNDHAATDALPRLHQDLAQVLIDRLDTPGMVDNHHIAHAAAAPFGIGHRAVGRSQDFRSDGGQQIDSLVVTEGLVEGIVFVAGGGAGLADGML